MCSLFRGQLCILWPSAGWNLSAQSLVKAFVLCGLALGLSVQILVLPLCRQVKCLCLQYFSFPRTHYGPVSLNKALGNRGLTGHQNVSPSGSPEENWRLGVDRACLGPAADSVWLFEVIQGPYSHSSHVHPTSLVLLLEYWRAWEMHLFLEHADAWTQILLSGERRFQGHEKWLRHKTKQVQ